MEDKPTDILRAKKNTSMYLAIDSVKNTEAVLYYLSEYWGINVFINVHIKTLNEIKRPSIASIWPNLKGEFCTRSRR